MAEDHTNGPFANTEGPRHCRRSLPDSHKVGNLLLTRTQTPLWNT